MEPKPKAKRVLFRRRFICWHCRKSLTWSRGEHAFVGYEVWVGLYKRIVHRFCASELGFDCRKETK